MTTLHIDFETRSTLDLKKVGLWNYARHPSTDVWCMAWAIDDAEPELWVPGEPMPDAVNFCVRSEGAEVYAHNVQFERTIWREIMHKRYGWPDLPLEHWHCTMVLAYAMGLPGGLEDASLALGLRVRKDLEGRALMLRMARPRRVEANGTVVWWDEPEKIKRLHEYCKQDVRVERELHRRLMPLPRVERSVWLMDQRINDRGARIDVPTAKAGVAAAEKLKEGAGQKLSEITGGAVQAVSALAAMKEWLATQGVVTESLNKETVDELLAGDALPEPARQALIVRQEVGKASVAKLDSMLNLAGDDERLHFMFQYWGAGTGRWAGRGVQPHNFVRDVPPAKVVEEIFQRLRAGELEWIDMAYGPPMAVISRCLRGFFIPAPGHVYLAGDFSAVEGRGTAWISGEQWKLDAFQKADRGDGPGIYELTASRMLGVPVDKITKELRQIGKVGELAFGYQGGSGAARNFLPAHMKDMPKAELEAWKNAWRGAHTMVKSTWFELEMAAKRAVQYPGEGFTAGFAGRQVTFKKVGSFLWCKLPSNRVLCYPYPKILPGEYGEQLTYMTVPSDNDRKRGALIQDPSEKAVYSNNWARVATYGGSLMENVVQALCRDLLVWCMRQLDMLGAKIVLHVHDEIVVEVEEAKAEKAREAMQHIMNTPPPWAAGFPMFTEVEILRRYGK